VYDRRVYRSLGRKIAVFAPLMGFRFVFLLLFDVHFGFALRRLRALPSISRKPAGARLDRALFLAHSFVFLLHFVGRQSDR